MAIAYLNGIRIEMDQNATIADYDGLVGQAAAEMIQFRETWGDDDFFAISRTGDAYTLQRINGQDVIFMGPVPPPVMDEEPYQPKIVHSGLHYVPAFHTFDSGNKFLGLTLCMSGKWGPPYFFIGCSLSDIHDFDYGLWNTYLGAEPPDPEEYVPKLIHTPYTMAQSELEEFFDMPAAHQYMPGDNWVSTGSTYINQYTSDQILHVILCSPSPSHMMYSKTGETIEEATGHHEMILWTDWAAFSEDQPVLQTFGAEISKSTGVWEKQGGSASVYQIPPEDSCSICYGAMATLESNWANILHIAPWHSSGYTSVGMSWSELSQTTGQVVDVIHGTFDGVEIQQGSYLAGLTQKNVGVIRQGARTTYPSVFPNLYLIYSNLNSYDNSTSHDFISVMGEQYVLREFAGQYGQGQDGRIHLANPRIYQIAEGEYITLASIARRNEDTFEYLCFWGDIEQYNDPAATFERTAFRRHKIDLLVDDQEVFGNGEFSLVAIVDEDEETA